jgi:hypothetical protein
MLSVTSGVAGQNEFQNVCLVLRPELTIFLTSFIAFETALSPPRPMFRRVRLMMDGVSLDQVALLCSCCLPFYHWPSTAHLPLRSSTGQAVHFRVFGL